MARFITNTYLQDYFIRNGTNSIHKGFQHAISTGLVSFQVTSHVKSWQPKYVQPTKCSDHIVLQVIHLTLICKSSDKSEKNTHIQ